MITCGLEVKHEGCRGGWKQSMKGVIGVSEHRPSEGLVSATTEFCEGQGMWSTETTARCTIKDALKARPLSRLNAVSPARWNIEQAVYISAHYDGTSWKAVELKCFKVKGGLSCLMNSLRCHGDWKWYDNPKQHTKESVGQLWLYQVRENVGRLYLCTVRLRVMISSADLLQWYFQEFKMGGV